MVFTSGDLPLSLLTPVTTNPRTSITTPTTNPTSPYPMNPLVFSLSALLLVVKTVLSTRAAQGDDFLRRAATSAASLDLADIMQATPTPVMSIVSPEYFASLYNTALEGQTSPFDVPGVTVPIDVFVDRLLNYGDVSYCVLLTALIYLDRFMACTHHMVVNAANIHQLFGVAFMLASKWHEDEFYATSFFARLIGVGIEDLNILERKFLSTVSFHLFVSPEHFKEAQIAFMAEAIDSACGLSVFQRLRLSNVAGVDEAADRAKTWHVFYINSRQSSYESENMHNTCDEIATIERCRETVHLELAPSPLGMRQCMYGTTASGNPEKAERRTADIMSKLARTQLAKDFPKLCWGASWLQNASRVYTERGMQRLDRLVRLARGVRAATILPPLEYQSIPHAYLTHVMSYDSQQNVCFGSAVTSPNGLTSANASFRRNEAATQLAWQRFGKVKQHAEESCTDWGYTQQAGVTGGINVMPSIWTAR